MEDDNGFYGVYDGGELYPARWDRKGYFVTQLKDTEFKTALDLILPVVDAAVRGTSA